MPLKLNVSTRPVIEDDFKKAIIDMWKARWKTLNEEVASAGRYKDMKAKEIAPKMALLRSWVSDKDLQGHQWTQLYTLPFVRYYTLEYKDTLWLAGLTKPVILTDVSKKRWHGPRYTIYVPKNVLDKGTGSKFHFVPEGYELEYSRHPHHNADWYGPRTKNPLDMEPNTCWGEFPTIVTNNIRSGDWVGLFRSLYLYTSRVNVNSLLTRPFPSPQFTPLPDAEPEPAQKKGRR